MLNVVPAQLHLASGKLSTAADDATPSLQATTGDDCGTGFPGATTAAHSALVEAWHREDRALLTALHDASAKLHHSAKTYAGTDDDNADHITKSAHPTPDTNGTPPTPLNL